MADQDTFYWIAKGVLKNALGGPDIRENEQIPPELIKSLRSTGRWEMFVKKKWVAGINADIARNQVEKNAQKELKTAHQIIADRDKTIQELNAKLISADQQKLKLLSENEELGALRGKVSRLEASRHELDDLEDLKIENTELTKLNNQHHATIGGLKKELRQCKAYKQQEKSGDEDKKPDTLIDTGNKTGPPEGDEDKKPDTLINPGNKTGPPKNNKK